MSLIQIEIWSTKKLGGGEVWTYLFFLNTPVWLNNLSPTLREVYVSFRKNRYRYFNHKKPHSTQS